MRVQRGAGLAAVAAILLSAGAAGAQQVPAEAPALTAADVRELLAAARETAKATREAVDYARVQPDILVKILDKLDKIEDKLDKVENAVKAQSGPPPRPKPAR